MKKQGFSLAEVLIALILVGVIAAISIPSFVTNSKNRANATKLSAIVSNLENAFNTMLATEAVPDLTETRFGGDQTVANLGRYLKLAGNSSTTIKDFYSNDTSLDAAWQPFSNVSGTATTAAPTDTDTFTVQTKNGVILIYTPSAIAETDNHPGSIGNLTIDVNGRTEPNRWGRDVFLFRIGCDGMLYPAGGDIYELMDDNTNTDYNDSNQGITSRLVENNYEIDY